MSKITLFSAVALSLGFSTVALASTTPAPTCYSIEHGEEGMGSTNSLTLPHMLTDGAWTTFISVTNTSDKFVNVKVNFSAPDGSPYFPSHFNHNGMFNANNSPLMLNAGGAILKPNETARLNVHEDQYQEVLFGRISWQADACIDSALVVSVRSQYNAGGSFGTSIELLNNGQPF